MISRSMRVIFIASAVLFVGLNLFASNPKPKEQPVFSFVNKEDTVSYSANKSNPQWVADLKTKYSGLKDERKLNDLLKQQNYIEALNYLWTEPDQVKRITWLEQKVNEGHPILMFELAEEYYLQDPTLSTYWMKTMPWLLAGARRTAVDAEATSDKSVSAAPDFLLTTYQDRILASLLTKFSQENFDEYIQSNQKEFLKKNIGILRKVMMPLSDEQIKNMPSPQWVFAHGMAAFLNKKNTIPPSQYNALRKKSAEEFLKNADDAEKRAPAVISVT